MLETVGQDLRHAARLLRAQPGFACTAVATLAIGIGATTATFSVIDAALLHPLPYPAPDRIFYAGIGEQIGGRQSNGYSPSTADLEAWQGGASGALLDVAIERSDIPDPIFESGEAQRITGARVTAGYFALFGIRPLLGRTFTAADTAQGAPDVVVLGNSYWRTRFGADPAVIGRQARLNGAPVTIVGVLPPFKKSYSVFHPLKVEPDRAGRRGQGWTVFARLAPGIDAADASLRMTAAVRGVPPSNETTTVRLRSVLEDVASDYRATVNVLASAVAGILLIACVNVAGLLLARGATRRQELAVRASIGAGRGRLIRQLLTESLLIAALAAVAGVAIAWLTLGALVANIPIELPDDAPARINVWVLAASAAMTIGSGILFGLWPALQLSHVRLGSVLSRGSRHAGALLSRRGGQLLIVVEVALAVVLLAGGGLMLRSFARILAVDVGFDAAHVITLQASTLDKRPGAQAEFYDQILAATRKLPGVAAAGAIDVLPMWGMFSVTFVEVIGGKTDQQLANHQVLPGYFEAMGIPVRSGRSIVAEDMTSGRLVAVINETAARELFDGAPAVGRELRVNKNLAQIVGVVADIRKGGPTQSADADLFLPLARGADPFHKDQGFTVVVRPNGTQPRLAEDLRRIVSAQGADVMLERVRPIEDWIGERIKRPRQRTVLLSILGVLGALLAMIGVMATTGYAVARRTREIGVRMAFGARPPQMVRQIVRDAAVPLIAGIGLGLGLAWLATGVIASFLFETTPTEPTTLAAVAATLALAGALAAWIPARRAARVDPVSALRAE
ncbi:MAG TPA: ADOP family duplicated permease [Vicinamibacterales bacterium]|nr:ADOP family duplicated permease [Vicinamibacterales bacterium]